MGAGIVLALLVWTSGATINGMFLGLGILLVSGAVYLWHRNRVAVRSVLRDLEQPQR